MNDRFKFRVWDVQNQSYIYFDLVNKDRLSDFAYFADEVTPDYDEQVRCPNSNCWALILEQCTGLKDCNGKLIYEGDIVRYGLHNRLIEWYRGGFWVNGFTNGASWQIHDLAGSLEVLGNVHENKELLKEMLDDWI